MELRIVDRPPDHRAKNPPVEETLDEPGTQASKQTVVVGNDVSAGRSIVLRGRPLGDPSGDLSGVTLLVSAPKLPGASATMASDEPAPAFVADAIQPVDLTNVPDVGKVGWVLMLNRGTYHVGPSDHRIVCKLRPSWELSADAAPTTPNTAET